MFGADGLLNVVLVLSSLKEADPMDSLGFSPIPEFGHSAAIYENARQRAVPQPAANQSAANRPVLDI